MRHVLAMSSVTTWVALAACGGPGLAPAGSASPGGDAGAEGGSEFAPADAASESEPGACERTVTLAVSIPDAGTPQPFDVMIVADNADGLTYSMPNLASGLKNLLANVAGQSARFFFLSTTQYGASSKAAVSQTTGKDLVSWSSTVTGAADANPVTQYSQQCDNGSGAAAACPMTYTGTQSYDLHGAWTFTMPPPIAAVTPGMTAAQIAAQEQAIANAILNSGGGGSEEEQPICTLSRYMTQPASVLPKRAVFIVISDEDDITPPAHCLAAYDFKTMPEAPISQVPCYSSNCQGYTFQAQGTATNVGLAYSCVPVDDKGVTYPSQGKARTLSTSGLKTCAATSCTADEQMLAANDCGTGYVVQNCTVTCMSGPAGCSLERSSNTPDICTQSFQQAGVTYANLADYCAKTTTLTDGSNWGSCQSSGFDDVDGGGGPTLYSATETTTRVVEGASMTADMATQFRTAATAAFGASGYRVETIQFDPSFSCPMGPGQSYGPTLRTLATTPADVFSICGDYSAALSGVSSFAAAIANAYPLTLAPGETIVAVAVVDSSGTARPLLSTDYAYDATAGICVSAQGFSGRRMPPSA